MTSRSAFDELRTAADGFADDRWPRLMCTRCKRSDLIANGINILESAASKHDHDDPRWEPDFIRGHFHGTLRCSAATCAEIAVVAGDYSVGYAKDDGGYVNLLTLRYIAPPAELIDFPAGTPDSVIKRTHEAIGLVLQNPNAAANRVRAAVEELLTQLRIPRTQISKSRRHRLTTHKRLERLEVKFPGPAVLLMAVKWIGNDGSHESSSLLTREVLDGLELFGQALNLIYNKRPKELDAIARRINRRKTSKLPDRRQLRVPF